MRRSRASNPPSTTLGFSTARSQTGKSILTSGAELGSAADLRPGTRRTTACSRVRRRTSNAAWRGSTTGFEADVPRGLITIKSFAYGQFTGTPPSRGMPAVQTDDLRYSRLRVMKKRILITGLILAALLLALYGVIVGTGSN